MKVEILDVCKKELKKFPTEILTDFVDAIAKLKTGLMLSMPLSKQMPSVGKHVHELRLKDKDGIYRIIYFIKKKEGVYIVHAFAKKTQKTPKKNIDLAIKRIKRLL